MWYFGYPEVIKAIFIISDMYFRAFKTQDFVMQTIYIKYKY
jgi:hypothetical protein